ncbi:PIN domain-containing protein [Actinosynnema sp. NPDC004786]
MQGDGLIVIDANELLKIPRTQHRLWRLLCEIANSANHDIATADITFEEFRARYEKNVQDAWRKLQVATASFREYGDEDIVRLEGAYDSGEVGPVISRRIGEFLSSMKIIVSDPRYHVEGLRREINRQLPAATSWDKPGIGARDVILWLTAVQECKGSSGKLFFVSNDARAFGKNELHPDLVDELRSELEDRADDFVYCRDLAELLPLLADRSNHEADLLSFDLLAADSTLRTAIDRVCGERVSALAHRLVTSRFDMASGMWQTVMLHRTVLRSIVDTSSYRVEGKVWLVATMRWRLEVRVDSVRVPKAAESFPLGYSGSLLETVTFESDELVDAQEFEVTAIVGVGHTIDHSPAIESVDIVSSRLINAPGKLHE